MASWAVFAQLTNGAQLPLNATDHIWLNGFGYGSNVVVGNYQDSTHVSDSNDIQRDTTANVHNTKYLSSSTVSIDGQASANINTVSSGTAPFDFRFTNGSSVATTGATFYAYDGVTDANPITGITFQAAEVGNASWTAANGSGNALTLQNQSTATQHDFFVCLSATPTSNGPIIGAVKVLLSYA